MLLYFCIGIICCLALYYVVILPYRRLLFYKKQGIEYYFMPIFGIGRKLKECELKHKDANHFIKELIKKNPKLDMFAFNIGHKVLLYIANTEIIKEILQNGYLYQKVPGFQIV